MTTATRPRAASAAAAPMELTREPLQLTVDELREGVRATFYPRIPADDAVGQDRVDRATDRLLEALGR